MAVFLDNERKKERKSFILMYIARKAPISPYCCSQSDCSAGIMIGPILMDEINYNLAFCFDICACIITYLY